MISKHKGRYDLCSTEEKWCVSVRLPPGAPKEAISQTWDLEDEPDIDGLPPSDVVELISERLESFLVNTRREEDRKVIEWVRENAEPLDALWAGSEIERLKRQIEAEEREIKRLEQYTAETEPA
jgi:hypothetical protein